MESKHNCIDCFRAEIVGGYVVCRIAVPIWIEQPVIKIDSGNAYTIKKDRRIVTDNCPAWNTKTPPQWTLPEWKEEGEYGVMSGVTHNGKRWECFKENGGKFGDEVEPGTDPNVWREAK